MEGVFIMAKKVITVTMAFISLFMLFVTCTLEGDIDSLRAKVRDEEKKQPCTVTFDANGGSGTAPAALTAAPGSGITLPNESGLEKNGYDFRGWNTDASGTGTNYSAGSSYTVTGDITLYARWIPESVNTYTVTFNANGGSGTVPAAQTTSSGLSITLPNEGGLSKDGFTFGGWSTDDSGAGAMSRCTPGGYPKAPVFLQ